MRRSQTYLDEREGWITETLAEAGTLSIDEVVHEFGVSPSTARKQLNSMHERGLLTRIHGGAVRSEQIEHRATSCFREKEAIAREARRLVKDGGIIAIGTGSTTFSFAKTLHDVKQLTVVTDSILIANELRTDKNIEVRVCSGVVKPSNGAIIGPQAERYFNSVYVDLAFVGVDAISVDFGVASADVYVSFSERGIVSCAKDVYVLADHTKFMGTACVDRLCTFDEVSGIITDCEADPATVEKLRHMNVNVIMAE